MTTRLQTLLLATALLVSGCSTLAPKPADEAYAQQLIGTWSGEYADSRGNMSSYGEKTYYADGRAKGFIVFPAVAEAGACSSLRKLSYESNWKIVDGVLEITDVVYTPASLNDDKDEVIRDRIISIDDNEARFEDLDDREVFSRQRVR